MLFFIVAFVLISLSYILFSIVYTLQEGKINEETENKDAYKLLYETYKEKYLEIKVDYYELKKLYRVQKNTLDSILNDSGEIKDGKKRSSKI